MSPRVLTAWWDRRSDPARVELYTRWTFHSFAVGEVLFVGVQLAQGEAPTVIRTALALLVVLHAGIVAMAFAHGLDWVLDRRERPDRLLASSVVGGVLLTVAGLALAQRSEAVVIAIVPLVFGISSLSVRMRPRHAVWLVLGVTVGITLAGLLTHTLRQSVGLGMGTLVFGCSMVFAVRFSTWMLVVVLELDAARETQARLAVAEERLRFSRDLHDVMGRNLSVIALKSELAAQLAQRGADSAVDEMNEVQRIARESQREVREVVRGYREAGLHTELAGARAVLRSAGIDCETETEGDDALPQAVESALGWVVREGTTNVLRHADAANCAIRLRVDDDPRVAVLTVANNGVRGAAGRDDGSGLAGLRERLAGLGGVLSTERGRDGTFQLTAEVPLDGAQADGTDADGVEPDGADAGGAEPDRRDGTNGAEATRA